MPATKARVRIAKATDPTGSRDIYVDGAKVGRCVKRSGIHSETSWSVWDTGDEADRRVHFFTLADVRAYFDPTPIGDASMNVCAHGARPADELCEVCHPSEG
jgi:hypothetical protein